jgi:hypothetical protein
MTSWAEITRLVAERAGERCEYCRMHQSLQGATFHIEHVHPTVLGGSSDLANLALACPRCNLCKSDRIEAINPQSGALVALYNPRQANWDDHFECQGYEIQGRTPAGRATAAAFELNSERRMRIRQAEAIFQLYPPGSS